VLKLPFSAAFCGSLAPSFALHPQRVGRRKERTSGLYRVRGTLSRRSQLSAVPEPFKEFGTGLRMTCPINEETISLAKVAHKRLATFNNLRKALHYKLICSGWLYQWGGGLPHLIESNKAKSRQHSNQSTECPEQTRIRAVED
jgi:hypothetical protein